MVRVLTSLIFKGIEWGFRKYEPLHGNYKQCGILTSVDLDEPIQPPFKLRNSK